MRAVREDALDQFVERFVEHAGTDNEGVSMPKERIVRATFSDGSVIERGSISKVYTHAYLFRGWRLATKEDERRWGRKEGDRIDTDKDGFSTSAEQAERNMRAEMAWGAARSSLHDHPARGRAGHRDRSGG